MKHRTIIILAVLFSTILALILRLIPLPELWNTGNIIGGPDSWYYLRMIETLMQNGIQPYADLFLNYGISQDMSARFCIYPVFSAALGILSGLQGVELTNLLCFVPAVFGALLVPVGYFVGKHYGDRTLGVLTALFIGVAGGELFARTLYGYTDHHASEILFSLLFCAAYVGALMKVKEYLQVVEHRIVSRGFWMRIFLPYILFYGALSGAALALALNASITLLWFGLFAGIFSVLQFIVELIQRRPWQYLLWVDALTVGVSALICALAGRWQYTYGTILSYIPGIGGGIPTIIYGSSDKYDVIAETVSGTFSRGILMFNFGCILALAGFVIVLIAYLRHRRPEHLFLLVWSVGMFYGTLMHVRWEYFFGVNIAILSAICIWYVVKQARAHDTDKRIRGTLLLFAVLCSVMFVGLSCYSDVANARLYIDETQCPDGVFAACEWLKENTPATGDYSVFSWGDYGYQIAAIADRAVITNAGWGNSGYAAKILLSDDEEYICAQLDEKDVRYLLITEQMASDSWINAYKVYAGDADADSDTSFIRQLAAGKSFDFLKPVFEKDGTWIFLYNHCK